MRIERIILPACVVAMIFFCELGPSPGSWFSPLIAPGLLCLFVTVILTNSLLVSLVTGFLIWTEIVVFIPKQLPINFSDSQLIGRGAVWMTLIFGTLAAIQYLLRRLNKSVESQLRGEHMSSINLKESESRASSIIKFAHDAFIGMNQLGLITDWNDQAEKIFGWSSSEVLGRTLAEVIVPVRFREAHETGMKKFLETGIGPVLNKRIEIFAIKRDSTEIPVELTIFPIALGSGHIFGSFLHDISDRKAHEQKSQRFAEELEAQVEVRTRELASAYEQATVASRMKDEFLATVSHEIRTPLGVILGYSDLMLNESPSAEESRTYLQTIHRNAVLQNQLVGDLLDVSKIITGKLQIESKVLDVTKLVNTALASVSLTASAKAIVLIKKIPARPLFMTGDADRLQQVLWNLLSNAVKFTPENGQIEVEISTLGRSVTILVRDSGKGIEASFLPHVFERFRQEDSATTRNYGGLGLGLAIVRHIVEMHGGSCAVSSEGPNKGATFEISMPLNEQQTQVSRESIDIQKAKSGELKGNSILIVDDERDSRELLAAVLIASGATVRSAHSVEVALEMFDEVAPNLLISDISMPKKDGFELIREIRNGFDGRIIYVPALALTARASVSDRESTLMAGFNAHLAKPFDRTELIKVCIGLIQQQG